MKILIATDNYYPNVNGAAYFAQRLAFYLKKIGHEVLVIAPSRKMSSETFEHEGINVFGTASIPLERLRITPPFVASRSIRRAIANFKPDVVHVQSHFPVSKQVVKVAKSMNIPVVGTNHFMPENLLHYLKLPDAIENMLKKAAWFHFLQTFKRLDAVTSPTVTAGALVQESGLQQPVLAISNGIDLQKFKPANHRAETRARYGLTDVPTFLFVGRLDKEKNLDLVLEAFAKVEKSLSWQLVVAGSGAEQENLKAQVQSLSLSDKVIFTGFVPDTDLPALYAVADCFVMAGTAELQSIATMEAMATGLPVLAVNAMALPELVVNGENGFLFEHEDVATMVRYITAVATDESLRQSMAKASLERIQKHDIDRVMREFVELYTRLQKGVHGTV